MAQILAHGWHADRALHLIEPYQVDEEPIIRFNPYTIMTQGVQLSAAQQALLEMRSIFDDRTLENDLL